MRYVYMRFPGGKSKCVTFSYDDDRKSDIRLSDMLNKYGIKCTFNINGLNFRNDDAHLIMMKLKNILLNAVMKLPFTVIFIAVQAT